MIPYDKCKVTLLINGTEVKATPCKYEGKISVKMTSKKKEEPDELHPKT